MSDQRRGRPWRDAPEFPTLGWLTTRRRPAFTTLALGYLGALLVGGALIAHQDAVNISRGEFEWPSVVLSNGAAEVIVIPSVARVMSFRLTRPDGAGDATPFWRNAALRGKAVDPTSNVWLNFGGDKLGQPRSRSGLSSPAAHGRRPLVLTQRSTRRNSRAPRASGRIRWHWSRRLMPGLASACGA